MRRRGIRGTPWEERAGIAAMAAGFYADVPDLTLVCDGARHMGDHMTYLWTLTGDHSATKTPQRVVGAEEWDQNGDKIAASRGWYVGADHARLMAGG